MKQNKNSFILVRLVLISIFLVIVLGTVWYWNYITSPADPQDTTQRSFSIPQGQTTTQVAERLYQERFIRSPLAFKITVTMAGKVGSIQAGEFQLSPSMTIDQILEALSKGISDVKVTLIEGWRIEEMADELNEKLQIDEGEFLRAAQEGYMFPDTYSFHSDVTADEVVRTLRENFDRKYTDDLKTQIKKQGLTPEEGVILASIVEREARSYEVRRMVASILLKRLQIGMALNADATVQYALGYQQDEKGWWKRSLTLDDLKVDSLYNTYIHAGLPPTPICNPSLSSLEAVANADPSTPYLYYYHDSQGNSYYAETLEEHNQNVAKYR